MKSAATHQKLRGGYYTPKPIADFLAQWAIQLPTSEVLEPSCGDGAILVSAANRILELGPHRTEANQILIHGVEFDPDEATKAENRVQAIPQANLFSQVHTGDFFAYCERWLSEGQFFDAVVGNPPFIRYQNFLEEHRAAAFQTMHQAGLHPNRLTNAWLPFLVASTLLLKEHGRIAMVIPAELLQVDYAAELRAFLSEQYSKITLITFKRLVFEGIQQEIVLLLGERNKGTHTGIRTIEVDGLDDLCSFEHTDFSARQLKPLDHSTEKWTRYFLEPEELGLLRELEKHPKLISASNIIDVDVGIVTGLNEFFVLTQEQVTTHSLEPYTYRIVGRSAHMPGVLFSDLDWKFNAQSNQPAFLLRLPDVPFEALPEPAQKYVTVGEERELHKGYKCRIRKHWYTVPSVWTPQAFMLRQVHTYPKLVVNSAGATCTDTIHRVKLLNGVAAPTIVAAFLNSLTFAFTEVVGRSYGGGVLELEPREAEKLPLPLIGAEALDIDKINSLLLAGKIVEVLDTSDKQLLQDGLGLTVSEISRLRGIWAKLRDRRINRK